MKVKWKDSQCFHRIIRRSSKFEWEFSFILIILYLLFVFNVINKKILI